MPIFCRLAAQNITAAEYFFDSDPGVGNGSAITVATPGTTVTLNPSISTASLSQGFHSLSIRTKDGTGVWSLYESRTIYLSSSASNPGPIVSAEYFIDTDPGVGNGIAVSVGVSGNTVTFTASISTVSMANGFHSIGIRTKNGDGVWSLYEVRAFYISSSTANAPIINSAEYFFDTDPGVGNGTSMSVGASGNTVNFVANISIASLSNGFHTLAIRTRNAGGVWSLYEARAFYISASTTNAPPISGAEYFIDSDPGVGNGTALSVGATANTVNFTASISTASLSNGFHTLAIRTKNTAGVWSLYQTGTFYISTSTTDMPVVSGAEYFIDTDPGVGNGSALIVTTPGNVVTQTFLCNVPNGTANGDHVLAIRTRDANGTWSLFQTATITVSGSPLPLNWLSFSGSRINNKIQLTWVTENELNTSHFEVERSANGIDFSSIGRKTALSRQHNDYQFDDVQPLKGVNFYRLRQVDKDGGFVYSKIIKILWSDNKNTLHLYPNPVRKNLYLEFKGIEKNVYIQIYDAAGRFVQSRGMLNESVLMIPVSKLSNGTYWIIISDGITLEKGQFVKQ